LFCSNFIDRSFVNVAVLSVNDMKNLCNVITFPRILAIISTLEVYVVCMPHIDTAMERLYLEKLLKVNAIIQGVVNAIVQGVSQSVVYIQILHYANPERIFKRTYIKQKFVRKKKSKKCQQKTPDVH
jgi:hypothetical protein